MERSAAAASRGLRLHVVLRYPSSQGLEQYAQRSQTRNAGTAAGSGAAGSSGEPDQSALSLQYAEFDFQPDPAESGTGSPHGHAAFAYYAGTPSQPGPFRASSGRTGFHRGLPFHRTGALRRQIARFETHRSGDIGYAGAEHAA